MQYHLQPQTFSLEDRPIGGLGVLMVKKIADSVSYERCGRNFAIFGVAFCVEV